MASSTLVRLVCRFYWMLLYAYPRPFRLQFGGEMQQLFQDRCRDVARRPERLRWLRFAWQSVGDWCRTAMQERFAARTPAAVAAPRRSLVGVVSTGVAEWAMTLIVLLFATTSLVQAYVVPTGSMEGTVRVGDHMLVDRMAYAAAGSVGARLLPYREVERGDVVVFHYPEDVRQSYVKRVIGIPGDRIHMVGKQVVRNGRRLVEPYTQHIDPMLDAYRDNFPTAPGYSTTARGREMFAQNVRDGELVVPQGKLFVMGDNRENSADSRYWGLVPRAYVVGKPLVIYWSYDAPTQDLEAWSFGHVVDVMAHFFTKTRWERTLHVPRSERARELAVAQ